VTETIADEERETAVLEHFDAADILSALSPGIVLLDAHLCAVYANRKAEGLLAVRLEEVRGRPLLDLLREPVAAAVRSALGHRMGANDPGVGCASDDSAAVERLVSVRAAPLYNQVTGTHVLLELHRNTQCEL